MNKILLSSLVAISLLLSNNVLAGDESVSFSQQISAEIKNYNRTSQEVATSGAVSADAIKELSDKGFKTIIDLRTEAEGTADEQVVVVKNGMSYINIPVTGAGISSEQLAEFTKKFESSQKPILIHCGSGNRVGAMLAAYHLSKGVAPETAFEIGRVAGLREGLEQKTKATFCKDCK